jgi:hypothetical protein
MNSIKGKPLHTRRRFLGATAATAVAGLGGYGVWRWKGESTYQASVSNTRRKLDDSKRLTEIVRYATLAPNSHNTQPWIFESSNDLLTIRPDFSRRCTVVDPDDHHLFASLGCACENAVLAAEALGRHAEVAFDEIDLTLRLAMEPRDPVQSDCFKAIAIRQSTRAPFYGSKLAASEFEELKRTCLQDDVEVLFYTEPNDMKKIEAFVVTATRSQLEDLEFMRELKHWMRFSYSEAVRSGDGLFGKCSNQPVLPGWLARNLIDFVFTSDSEIKNCEAQLRSSAGIAVFVGKENRPTNWISVGRCFERFALQAAAMGILHSHINQPVEVTAVRPDFAKWLGVGDRRPDLVIRFGKGKTSPYSLRRPVEDVLKSP